MLFFVFREIFCEKYDFSFLTSYLSLPGSRDLALSCAVIEKVESFKYNNVDHDYIIKSWCVIAAVGNLLAKYSKK